LPWHGYADITWMLFDITRRADTTAMLPLLLNFFLTLVCFATAEPLGTSQVNLKSFVFWTSCPLVLLPPMPESPRVQGITAASLFSNGSVQTPPFLTPVFTYFSLPRSSANCQSPRPQRFLLSFLFVPFPVIAAHRKEVYTPLFASLCLRSSLYPPPFELPH